MGIGRQWDGAEEEQSGVEDRERGGVREEGGGRLCGQQALPITVCIRGWRCKANG